MTVRLVDIAATYDGRTLYRHLSLTVETGEIVSLVGPSGSGKSTLLRIIAGIERPVSGIVEIDGRDVTSLPIHRRGVGIVFQDNQLFPHLDVAGNVGYGLRVTGRSSSERVTKMLALVGLSGFEARRVDTLSGGEAKRVALARTLVTTPRVLLLDEPLTGLDAQLHHRLLADISQLLASLRTTVVHVTHDMAEATALSTRVVHIAQLDAGSVSSPEADHG